MSLSFHGVVVRVLGVSAAIFMLVSAAFAQVPTIAQLLQNNPNGGPQLTSAIRDLALADRANLPIIIAALADANGDQQSAAGAGLGQAAQSIAATNQEYANAIQQAVIASGIQATMTAYAAVTGNVQIAAGAGGGGGGTAGGGGGGGPVSSSGGAPSGGSGGGGGSSSAGGGSSLTANAQQNLFSSAGGSVGGGSGSSVSP